MPDSDLRLGESRKYVAGEKRKSTTPARSLHGDQDEFAVMAKGKSQIVSDTIAKGGERKRAEEALRQAERKYRDIFESSGEGIFQTTPSGRFIVANSALARMFGFESAEELINTRTDITSQHYVEPQKREEFKRLLEENGFVQKFEYQVYRKDGGRIWISENVRAVRDDSGTVVYYEGTAQDITERKQAEEELRTREAQLTDAQRLAHLGSWEWDLATNTVNWSDEMFRIWGLGPREFAGSYKAVFQLVHPSDRESFAGCVEKAIQDHQSYELEFRIIRPDATRRIVQARGAVVVDEAGRAIRMFGTAQDITERKLAEDEIKATNDLLRALSAKLQSAREEEGTRIARELHDELGSALTSVNWGLEEVDKRLSAGDRVDLSALRTKVKTMVTLVDSTIDTVRRISSELRPSVLDDLGLVEAIEWQAQQFQAQTGIIYQSDCSVEDIGLNREQSTAVFRIFQEALTNILRHAEATRFSSTLKLEANSLVLIIGDNGKGITASEVSRPQSLGLLGMRERAHLVGGEINISGAEGQGTVITVRVPLVARRTITVSGATRS